MGNRLDPNNIAKANSMLRKFREDRGMSMDEVAKIMKFTRQYVYICEKSKAPAIAYANAFVKKLNLTVSEQGKLRIAILDYYNKLIEF